jgi:hypothetical protein
MKHSTFAINALVSAGKPGSVAIAKNDEPMANSQHCRVSVAAPAMLILRTT